MSYMQSTDTLRTKNVYEKFLGAAFPPKTGRMRGTRLSEYVEHMAKTADEAGDRFSAEPEGTDDLLPDAIGASPPHSLPLFGRRRFAASDKIPSVAARRTFHTRS